MDISVIIPSHKPQDYIFECLDSLASQTFPKERFEVIIVLNGCNEPYQSRINEYLHSKAAKIKAKFVQTDVAGVSNARNIAIDMSEGKYLAFIDDDDYVSPQYLEEMNSKASEDTIILCRPFAFHDGCTSPVSYRPAELYSHLSPKGKQSLLSARKLLHITCMKLIPREMIADRRFNTSFTVGEDTLMMFVISDKIKHVDFSSDKAVYYRRFRKGSAVKAFMDSSMAERTGNRFRLIREYTRIFFSDFGHYSFLFYLTRIWGALHSIFKI